MSQDILDAENSPLIVNARGLKCPMPVIKLQQAIRQLDSHQQIWVECTDLGAEKDIASWCKVNKHTFQQAEATDYGIKILVETR